MQINTLWNGWIDNLNAVLVSLRETWRARRTLVIAREDARFVIRQEAATKHADGTASPSELSSARTLAAAARRRFVTFELAAEELVLQRIQVPARAREFLAGIVRNQIDRLSPWPSDQVLFGFDAEASRQDPAQLDARVMMTSRAHVEAVRRELAALGVEVDRITAREPGAADMPPVTLWSSFERGQEGRSGRRPVAVAVLAVLGLSLGLSAWALASAVAIRTDSNDVAEHSALVQRQLESGRAGGGAVLNASERAWNEKATKPPAVVILDTLSQALPDTAYVTELSLQKTTLRIVGLTSDAPALLSPLEQSKQFAGAHFFAPTTRGPDGTLFWFHIEAQVAPHFDIPEN